MENSNDILNKAVKLATEGMQIGKASKEKANNMITELKKVIKKESPEEYEKILAVEKLAKSGNINKILDLQKELYANKGKY